MGGPDVQRAEATKTLAENRRALFDYHIERRIEAGIALLGSEIKSVRGGHVNLRDGYARVDGGEVWLRNVHIAPWAQASYANHDPVRPRKLLLHRSEIGQLAGELSRKGLTLVPLRLYLRNGVAKVELGLARGKKRYDKREAIRERELAREVAREMEAASRRGPPR
jgi:SsrA-binding protein